MPKVLFQMYIDKKQRDYIMKKSEDTGKSRALIIREVINDYMRKELKEDEEKLSDTGGD